MNENASKIPEVKSAKWSGQSSHSSMADRQKSFQNDPHGQDFGDFHKIGSCRVQSGKGNICIPYANMVFEYIFVVSEYLNRHEMRPFENYSTQMFEDRSYRKTTQVILKPLEYQYQYVCLSRLLSPRHNLQKSS